MKGNGCVVDVVDVVVVVVCDVVSLRRHGGSVVMICDGESWFSCTAVHFPWA